MTDKDTAVEVKNLTKSFHIPLEASNGLKQKLVNLLNGNKGYRIFTPLNDVSFEIKKGDFFGVVGRNGSGKSTLLKTIAGIYTPKKGSVTVNGTLVPFIELGVGFNPELTGRENVYLNGALLGFSREEMDVMYNDIVDFAELHDFMEERLKNYSSGMQVRLAFSIAIRAHGDILLLDEVLAVGDEAFQRKCFEYFESLKKEKHTVILVSHDMAAVERYCNKAMFIKDGSVVEIGSPHKIAALYSRANMTTSTDDDQDEDEAETEEKPSKIKIDVLNMQHKRQKVFQSGDFVTIRVSWPQDISAQHVGVSLVRKDGTYVFGTNTYRDSYAKTNNKQSLLFTIKADISEGTYFIKAGLFGSTDANVVDFEEGGPEIKINRNVDESRWGGLVKLIYRWEDEDDS